MVKAFDKAFCALPRTITLGGIAIFLLGVTGYPIYTIVGDSPFRPIGDSLMISSLILTFVTPFFTAMDIQDLRNRRRKQKAGSQYDSYELCWYGICERWECDNRCNEWQTVGTVNQ